MHSTADTRLAPPGGGVRRSRPISVEQAVDILAGGGLVAFPTETVWGLAADSAQPRALAALRAWKGRDAGQPTSLLVSGREAVDALGLVPTPSARALARAFWPGPLTLVVPGPAAAGPSAAGAAAKAASGVGRADGAVGLRCSSHPVAAALARAAEAAGLGPPTATSLNRHGDPPARTAAEAASLAASGAAPIPWLAARPDAWGEAPSTVVDCTTDPATILREGAVDAAALARTLEPRPGSATGGEPDADAGQNEESE